ncbi:MAG TPA: helix-turn-helix domain-containing protein [Steroidobacteraceae bacterium]|nr:helix-turn-helix domain-containing protein [Steroidobacteraceae bacterium]
MPMIVTLDVMLASRKLKARDLSEPINVSKAPFSLLHSGKVRAVCFSTPATIGVALDCKPGDLLEREFHPDDVDEPAFERDEE